MTTRMNLLRWFTYHSVKNDQAKRYEEVREAGLRFAEVIDKNAPYCMERDIAFQKVREAVLWTNAGIACNE